MKSSKALLDLLTHAQSSTALGALSSQALTDADRESVPSSSFPFQASESTSMSQQVSQNKASHLSLSCSENSSGRTPGIWIGKGSYCKIYPWLFKQHFSRPCTHRTSTTVILTGAFTIHPTTNHSMFQECILNASWNMAARRHAAALPDTPLVFQASVGFII